MARSAKRLAPIGALLGSLIITLPAQAESNSERILQEIQRLNQRMAQLEADNARLKDELAASNEGAREKEIVGRLEDVERQVSSQDKKTRLLDSGGDMDVDAYGFAPGLILSYSNNSQSPDYWKASVGMFSSGLGSSWDTDLTRPFVIGQLEAGGDYFFGKEGVYRLYAWNRGRAPPFAKEFDSATARHSGWGVSANQQVAEHVSVFARYGHSLEGNMRFAKALTVGAEIGGAYWGREHDRIGMAAGWADTTKAFRAAEPGLDADGDGVADFGYAPDSAENQFEIYYAWKANDYLELSPDYQWIASPGGDSSRKDIAIVGLRAAVSY